MVAAEFNVSTDSNFDPSHLLELSRRLLKAGHGSYRMKTIKLDGAGVLPVQHVSERILKWTASTSDGPRLPPNFRQYAKAAMQSAKITGEPHILLVTEILRYPYGPTNHKVMRTAPLKVQRVTMRDDESFEIVSDISINMEAKEIIESFGGRIADGAIIPPTNRYATVQPVLFLICINDSGAAYDAALNPKRNPTALSAPALLALAGSKTEPAAAWPPQTISAQLDDGQKATIEAIAAGVNVRIFGPPGCGKSQVITEAIIMARAAGKTVLVGASVPSALSVIRRRLAKVGVVPNENLVIADIGGVLKLDRDRPYFDLLMIDEATRLSVAEAALFAIRARQIVVCGDPKQMRPDQGRPDLYTLTESRDFTEKALTRHYRSQDNKLIFFSNAMNYGMRLKTMPTPFVGRRAGVDLVYVKNSTAVSELASENCTMR